MDFLNELFGSEMGELKRHQKTEEEIKKFCTNEDFSELQRAVHLLKKGYEIQKISVINHLDRYLVELGANELLLQIIIVSDKLIDQKNLQKICKFSVEILVSEECAENEQLVEAWYQVFDVIVKQTDLQFCLKNIFPAFMELSSLKSPLPKRKKGNRILISFAKQIGENGFDKEPGVLKLIQSLCRDNNYKIRMDGVLFFKEYMSSPNIKEIIGHPRFKSTYIPDLFELLNDEVAQLRIEALDILTSLLDQFEHTDIENEYVKELLRITTQDSEEIQLRLAELIGKIVFKLKPFELHIKHRETLMDFFKLMVNHQDIRMRRLAAFNLPCFNQLYKEYQDEFDFDFCEIYLKYSKEEDQQILKAIAASIHEAFSITSDQEDTQKLRDAFKNVIGLDNRETMAVISDNIDVSLSKYCNLHAVKTYASLLGGPKEETPAEAVPTFKKMQTLKVPTHGKAPVQKKVTNLQLDRDQQQQQPEEPPLLPFILPDYMSEVIYQDLLSKLLLFDANLQNAHGLWRSQIKYLSNLSKWIHLFNMPEFQESFLSSLFEYIKGGNSEIRQAASDCIARILQYQYNSTMRQELISDIKTSLAESNSCVLRKTFLFFCKSAVNTFSRSFFKQHFLQSYLSLSKDKVAAVRMEFANTMVYVKPFLDSEASIANELMTLITQMHSDIDRDVVEAAETCDYALLHMKKRNKEAEKSFIAQDNLRMHQEAALTQREVKEEEERKKRNEEEEETKFDFQAMLAETNKKFRLLQRGKMGPFTLGGKKGGFGALSSKPSNGTSSLLSASSKSGQSSLLTVPGSGSSTLGIGSGSSISGGPGDKTPQKKKAPGAGSSTGGTKKIDTFSSGGTNKSINSGSGTVLGSSTGINQQNSSDKKTSGNSLGTGTDFHKRQSVLVTTSSQSLSGGLASVQNSTSASKGANKNNHLYGRKSSFMSGDQ